MAIKSLIHHLSARLSGSCLSTLSIRTKLIGLFVLIKLLPLLVLAFLAWQAYQILGKQVVDHAGEILQDMRATVQEVGTRVTNDSIRQLDVRSREAIERLTTDTARSLADFLYDRDADSRTAALLEPTEAAYRAFLQGRVRGAIEHGPWRLAEDGKSWEPAVPDKLGFPVVTASLPDNQKDFHYRPPERIGKLARRPLYLEMTFIGLDGRERVKVTTGRLLGVGLRNVADPANTFVKAETYFSHLGTLAPNQIYVSDVIGAYRPSPIIGAYTPERAKAAGIPFEPEKAAYAGKENPVGRRFEGLIRWATPVVRGGKKIGYVTLALDHTHIRQFTDHLIPNEERYTAIPDAANGNYAFLWDYNGRSIAHPRDYSIPGYDPATGKPVPPWLEEDMHGRMLASGLPSHVFLARQAPYFEQSQQKRQSREQMRLGQIALDCRYLNSAPQCAGWHNLTQDGGSGSFVILWSGLWKLTTAAAIPYFTGQYGTTPAGFGWVTIGANVDEFHKSATETKARIDALVATRDRSLQQKLVELDDKVREELQAMTLRLSWSTALMMIAVIAIAIWMASVITSRITALVSGLRRFKEGDYDQHLLPKSQDEIGQVMRAFNSMAETVRKSVTELSQARDELEQRVTLRTAELREANAALERLATTDELTGAYNRRHFIETGQREIVRSQRQGQPLSLIMLDIDHFKNINDCYGHAMGDTVLRQVAAIFKQNVREYDCFARIGGEEFVVLQPDTSILAATAIAERIRSAVEQETFMTEHGAISITLSAGIAVLDASPMSLEALMAIADEALYRAKSAGRNQVVS
jgi:diguanylate cyclase (GGDEF)-like protein